MPWHKPLCSTTIYLQGGHPLTAHASLPPQQRWTVTNMPETNVLNYPQLTPSPEDGSLTCDGILTKCTDSEADGKLLLRNRHFICQVHLGLRMPRPQHRGSYMCLQGLLTQLVQLHELSSLLFLICIYLAVRALAMAHGIFLAVACGIYFSDQGWNLGPLH